MNRWVARLFAYWLLLLTAGMWFALFIGYEIHGPITLYEPNMIIRRTEIVVAGLITLYGLFLTILQLRKPSFFQS